MTEAKFAGKQIEEFPYENVAGTFASSLAILAGLTEYFLMGDRPRDRSNRNREHKQPYDLKTNWQWASPRIEKLRA